MTRAPLVAQQLRVGEHLLFASAKMQKSFALLVASQKELEQQLTGELLKNPLLALEQEPTKEEQEEFSACAEESISTENHSFEGEENQGVRLEEELSQKSSPLESIKMQLRELYSEEAREEARKGELLQAALLLSDDLDHRGFLTHDVSELAKIHQIDVQLLETLRHEMALKIEPLGLGSYNEQEALVFQLRARVEKERSKKELLLAIEIIEKSWHELLANEVEEVAKKHAVETLELQELMQRHVLPLSFFPLAPLLEEIEREERREHARGKKSKGTEEVDLLFEKREGEWVFDLLGRLELRFDERALMVVESEMRRTSNPKERARIERYFKKHLSEGSWLMKALAQRYWTLERISELLLEELHEYFEEGALKPLSMSLIAKKIGRSPSTISRAVAGKTLLSPRGVEPLRALFTSSLRPPQAKKRADPSCRKQREQERSSSRLLCERLKELIAKEPQQKPLSDEKLAAMLQEEGIYCARRTVAKYRAQLKIPKASLRKKHLF